MKDRDRRPAEHIRQGAQEVKRGVEEMGRGVRDVAVDAVENVRDSVRNVIPTTRDKVVMVRVSKDCLDRMDDLVEAGVAGSRSEAADYLINEGIKAKRAFFNTVAEKVEEIRRAKEELRRLSHDERAVE